MAEFHWTEQKNNAAVLLAEGFSQREVSERVGCSIRTVERMMAVSEFRQEVDKLSLMVGVGSKAERIRLAMRVIRQRVKEDGVVTDKDILDWLKYVQSEKEGIKLNLDSAFNAAVASLAGGGQTSPDNSDSGNTEEA